ncbi:MAG: hypothetical protein ACYTDV_09585 [Planctomycetota bacterium]
MKKPITKFAAAALIIIAVILGSFEFTGTGTTSGVVWAEVLEKTEQISALVYDMTIENDQPGGENLVLQFRNYVARDYGTRADIYIDGKLSKIRYILPTQKVGYSVYVDRKTYRRYELSDAEMARGCDPEELTTCLKNIQSGGGYTELGRAEINGVAVEGIEVNGPDMSGEGDCFMRVWVDVETNLPVQIIMEMLGKEAGQMRPHKYLMENFEWNASLDEKTFEPNIPDDYTLIEDLRAGRDRQENSMSQQVSPQPLTEQEKAEQPKVKEAVRRFFNAFIEQDWDTVSKYLPDLEMSQRTRDILAGLETIYIGEPAKATYGGKWLVPYEIKFKYGGSQKNTLRLKADENTGQYIVRGGL